MRSLLSILVSTLLLACGASVDPVTVASAEIIGDGNGNGTQAMGSFSAIYSQGVVSINISLKDQFKGSIRAIQIFDGSCDTMGQVWNANTEDNQCTTISNGEKWFKPKLGDLGNLVTQVDGTSRLEVVTNLISIGTGLDNDIIGKLIVVRGGPQDFFTECDPNHIPDHVHTNPPIGCGSIQLTK